MMNKKHLQRFIGGFLISCLIFLNLPGSPVAAESPTSLHPAPLSPQFIQWEQNGSVGKMPSPVDISHLNHRDPASVPTLYASLPRSYDLRDYGKVEPVYNQGSYGICWAISANSSIVSSILQQFPQCSFSPMHTAWFSSRGDAESELAGVNDPYVDGGFDATAIGSLSAWKGPVPMEDFPLSAPEPYNPNESLRYVSDFHLQDAIYVPTQVVPDDSGAHILDYTKSLIMKSGAVAVNCLSSSDTCFNAETSSLYCDEFQYADHAVQIIGWDDDYPKENFAEGHQPSNNGAWLIRNSWGTSWGEDGLFWISYEDQSMTPGVSYHVEDRQNYARIYQYDAVGAWVSMASEDNLRCSTMANIYTAQADELLEAVSFYTTDMGTNYAISIYTGTEEAIPDSGTLRLDCQSGTQAAAGYHTVELGTPVPLRAGERFSIVIRLENPVAEYPLALEAVMDVPADYIPQYAGNGGESFTFNPETGLWEDVASIFTYDDGYAIYCTNCCIKGFTNPLSADNAPISSVRFSQLEGPLADGTQLKLSADGCDRIFYSLNSGAFQEYSGPITLPLPDSTPLKVTAYGEKGGLKGLGTSRAYHRAQAQLTDLAILADYDSEYQHLDTAVLTQDTVSIPHNTPSIQITAQSCDTIEVNGAVLPSSELSSEIPVSVGEELVIPVTVSGVGKDSSVYQVKIYRNAAGFDYTHETILVDESAFLVTDPDGNILHNGDSITHLIQEDADTPITVKNLATSAEHREVIPGRPVYPSLEIDFENELSYAIFGPWNSYSYNPDMSDSISCEHAPIPIVPGKDIYLKKNATDHSFHGNIYHWVIPDRPAAPEIRQQTITETSVMLEEIEMGEYSLDSIWQDSPLFENLTPGQAYTFSARYRFTDSSFASEAASVTLSTLAPDVNPADYTFTVHYVDRNGDPAAEDLTIPFRASGGYAMEHIPVPEGFAKIVPDAPDSTWTTPTSLSLLNGVWTVTESEVTVPIEALAAVTFTYRSPEGLLSDRLNYTKYYGEGIYAETLTAPDGYILIGENTCTVRVTRDAAGNLIASIPHVVIAVKASAAAQPDHPAPLPTAPETTPTPAPSVQPSTGDSAPVATLICICVLCGNAATILLYLHIKKCKQVGD